MKTIIVSQRTIPSYGILHDGLDRRWFGLLHEVGVTPILLPNHYDVAMEIVDRVRDYFGIDGILITGGETPVKLEGANPARDTIDNELINLSKTGRIPLIGVCRGMECILLDAGVKMVLMNQMHLQQLHPIVFSDGTVAEKNSYHTFGAMGQITQNVGGMPIAILAQSEDGVIEAITVGDFMLGMMWHPERVHPGGTFDQDDIALFRKWYHVESV